MLAQDFLQYPLPPESSFGTCAAERESSVIRKKQLFPFVHSQQRRKWTALSDLTTMAAIAGISIKEVFTEIIVDYLERSTSALISGT